MSADPRSTATQDIGSAAAVARPARPPRPRLVRRLRNRLWREIDRRVPHTRWGDRGITWLRFVLTFHRLPRRDGAWWNDRLYAIKTSGELLDPLRVFTSDKELLKLYVRATIGDQHNVPTLKVLHSPAECRAYDFPARCVIKATHCSGETILRRRGEAIDFPALDRWFAINYYHHSDNREANYRQLKPKVIVEPYVFDDDNPNDYKIFCIDGEPRMVQVDVDRHLRHTRCLFDTDWRLLPFTLKLPQSAEPPPRPANLQAMLAAARRLAAPFGLVRVDLYSDGERFAVGELTHCPGTGREHFLPAGSEAAASALLFDVPR